LLDMYEGSYTKEDIVVVVGRGTLRQRKAATAYIADYPDTTADDFVPPSEQYRTAIDVHLRENWGAAGGAASSGAAGDGGGGAAAGGGGAGSACAYTPLGIRRVDSSTQSVTEPLEQWANPGAAKLTLEAFCVEANVLRKVPWVMPRTITEIVGKLNQAGITTVSALAAVLREDAADATKHDGGSGAGDESVGDRGAGAGSAGAGAEALRLDAEASTLAAINSECTALTKRMESVRKRTQRLATGNALNEKLIAAGQKPFALNTLANFRQLLA